MAGATERVAGLTPPVGGARALLRDVHSGYPGPRSLPDRGGSPSGLRLLPELARGPGQPLPDQRCSFTGGRERERPDRQEVSRGPNVFSRRCG